jgi:hypothetical protein
MLSRIPGYVLLAALVTSGSALAARTDGQAGGQATKPAAAKPAAPAPGSAAGAKPAQCRLRRPCRAMMGTAIP